MDRFWDVLHMVAEAAVLFLFAGAVLAVGMLMSGVH